MMSFFLVKSCKNAISFIYIYIFNIVYLYNLYIYDSILSTKRTHFRISLSWPWMRSLRSSVSEEAVTAGMDGAGNTFQVWMLYCLLIYRDDSK